MMLLHKILFLCMYVTVARLNLSSSQNMFQGQNVHSKHLVHSTNFYSTYFIIFVKFYGIFQYNLNLGEFANFFLPFGQFLLHFVTQMLTAGVTF